MYQGVGEHEASLRQFTSLDSSVRGDLGVRLLSWAACLERYVVLMLQDYFLFTRNAQRIFYGKVSKNHEDLNTRRVSLIIRAP